MSEHEAKNVKNSVCIGIIAIVARASVVLPGIYGDS